MPVVMVLGGDPASMYSASARLPPSIDEYVFAGFLRRKPVTMTKAVTAVLTWVGGFDIFYALQDERFDREHGLHSAVALLGPSRSILIGKVLHAVTLLGLVVFGVGASHGTAYYAGVAVAAVLLAWEHSLVRPHDLSRLDAAFFTMNGIISVVLFLAALGDRTW